MSRPTRAVVSLAALDVRAYPRHRAELTSQLLLGEVVRLRGRSPDGEWWSVENLADGYRGWVRGWGLVPASVERAGSWQARAGARVVVPILEARARPGAGASVGPLFLGARVIPGARRGTLRRVELPDGRRGWVPARALTPDARPLSLGARVRSLLGVPYHWGGRTALGLDCSAFVQLVLGEQGLALPRDVRGQFGASRALEPGEEPLRGDLAFFREKSRLPTHVGIALGGAWLAHCRGLVRIASLDPHNPLIDNELRRRFIGWRRPR